MSLSSTRSPSRPRTRAAAEVPILMRLPDLRLPAQPPKVADEPLPAAVEKSSDLSTKPAEAVAPPESTEPQVPVTPPAVATVEPSQPNIYALVGGHVARYLERFSRANRADKAELDLPQTPAAVEATSSEPDISAPPPAMTTSAPETKPDTHQVRVAERRQKARERQRRLEAESPRRSWWTSHAPVIAIGFLLALVLTIYVARSNRHAQSIVDQAALEPEVPEVQIDDGSPSVTAPAAEAPAMAAHAAPESEAPAPALDRSPALLAAKPEVQPSETPSSTSTTTSAQPDGAAYPATDSTMYRPGGRTPRTTTSAEPAPNYPSTSAPQTWR